VPKVSSRYERARTREVANWVVEEQNAPTSPTVRWPVPTTPMGQHTLQQLADDLTDRGFTMPATVRLPQRPVAVQQVHKVLRNRYYLGPVTFAGAKFEGRHEALIDQTTFDVVRALLASATWPATSRGSGRTR
jgi:site-specific DNA recombinase